MMAPMTRTRFHHLTVCALRMGVCFALAWHYGMSDWQYWLLMALAIYAEQPLINESRAWLAAKWRKREPADPYALVGLPEPVDVTHK